MQKNMRHRLPMLRELQLKFSVSLKVERDAYLSIMPVNQVERAMKTDAVAHLADLLEQAHGLSSFAMDDAEVWLTYGPRIPQALCRMRHLSVISLDIMGPALPKLLRGLQSTPRMMIVRQPSPSDLLLGPFLGQCTALCSSSVECLVVEDTLIVPTPPVLACMFPNVRRLHMCAGLLARPRSSRVPGWPLLQHVRGSAVVFADWRLSNPVHLFKITCALAIPMDTGPDGRIRASQVREAAVVALRNVQPVAFQANLEFSMGEAYWSDFLTASR